MAASRRKSAPRRTRGKAPAPDAAAESLFETGGVSDGQTDDEDGESDDEVEVSEYNPIHVKKAPPLPGTTESGEPAVLEEMGNLPVDELVGRLKAYGLDVHEGMPRSKLLVAFLRTAHKHELLVFGVGQLEIMPDGYGFMRSARNSFLSSPDDLYVSRELVKQHGLRAGQVIEGVVRTGRRREKYFAIESVSSVNGATLEQAAEWKQFDDLIPIFPDRRVLLETDDSREMSARVVDLVAPIGFGQRGLIVAPPRAGKTMMLKALAHSIAKNYPAAKLLMFLVDERPEEVTTMQREVAGEVLFSTFDEPPSRHVQVARRVNEHARSLVESGHDVILLLDSLTRLGRAFNANARGTGRILSGGLEANALQEPKRLFGSARNTEDGGSLTVLATVLIETGSRMDEVIFEEFKGTGNMELVLSRAVQEQRIYPAVDINKSGTRMEDLIFDPAEAKLVSAMRQALADLPPVEAIELLLTKLRKTATNAEFLLSIANTKVL